MLYKQVPGYLLNNPYASLLEQEHGTELVQIKAQYFGSNFSTSFLFFFFMVFVKKKKNIALHLKKSDLQIKKAYNLIVPS